MPELPEVETVRKILEPQLAGRTIVRLTLNRPDIIDHPSAEIFSERITGMQIAGMGRRGKFLSLKLANQDRLILHLRMTGQLLVTLPDDPVEKHTHIIFHLDDGKELRFTDPRRFGRFWLLSNGEEDIYSGIHKLGIEPFDSRLTADWLQRQIGRRKKSIKECLLEQKTVAGIGNIYGDEILFEARICPARPACSLTGEEWSRLAAAIPSILQKGIRANRMTPEEYLAGRGKAYRKEPFFRIYGHEGDPCPCCRTSLTRIVLSGRSSFYCPECQKRNPAIDGCESSNSG
ncbi:MAG: bifunctional DNA-formamidopyrimidine glycosylase/DNA-(apurinic or apyrimidinic site) lyase [Eubacteriales bacterium]|nr:bifunctional DNA-formamidopyrimidine glycosylase/DNA-(apurinic or apyrimidinic site) lyase [Eubacteriales bacterium]